MSAFSLLIGATLLTSAASLAQTNVEPPRMKLQLFSLQLIPVRVGQTYTVYVSASNPQAGQVNLYGYQFDLKFDPTKLQAITLTEGVSFQRTGVSDFVPGIIDNAAGVIKTSFNSLQGTAAAVRDTNPQLAVVQFKALQVGSAVVSLQYPMLVDETGARPPLTIVPTATLLIQ